MAIPTVTGVSPARGYAGGETLVEVKGTGFQLPPPPPMVMGPVPEQPPTVRVFFGGVEASRVSVLSEELLLAVTPRHAPGLVGVEVQNVGRFGELLGPEKAVLASAFTFERPELTQEHPLQAVVRVLIRELKRQVYPEVVYTQSTDWSAEPEDALRKVADAKVPALILAGPRLRKSENAQLDTGLVLEAAGEGFTQERRRGRTVDLVFNMGVIAEDPQHFFNLMGALQDFPERNATLTVGEQSYTFGFEPDGDLQADSEPSNSNLLSALGTVAVQAFTFQGIPGMPADRLVGLYPDVQEVGLTFYQLHPEE